MKAVIEVRSEIDFLKRVIYLDSAAVSPCPAPVVEAMREYYEENPLNYGVGVSKYVQSVNRSVDEARRNISLFIGGKESGQIVFTKNTTEAINLVASGLNLSNPDEVLLTNVEHQSNIIPWQRLAQRKGIKVKFVHADKNGFIRPSDIEASLNSNTRLIAITHISNILGTIQDILEIGNLAKKNKLLFFVDAAQSAGRFPIDVQAANCDFAAFCGRKSLMGPQGTGFLYLKNEMLESIEPLSVGSRSANIINESSFKYVDCPFKLEAGILNTAGVIGLGRAIDYLNSIGVERIRAHIVHLSSLLAEGLNDINRVKVYSPKIPEMQGGIISWSIEGVLSEKIARWLADEHNIIVASGALGSRLLLESLSAKDVVRTSLHYYNTESDVELLVNAVRDFAKRNI